MVYVDGTRPDLAEGFTRRTFTAMIRGVREPALAAGLMGAEAFDEGVRALERTAEPDGVFCYTFFKAWGVWRRRGWQESGTPLSFRGRAAEPGPVAEQIRGGREHYKSWSEGLEYGFRAQPSAAPE
jgi:hypothetical protein